MNAGEEERLAAEHLEKQTCLNDVDRKEKAAKCAAALNPNAPLDISGKAVFFEGGIADVVAPYAERLGMPLAASRTKALVFVITNIGLTEKKMEIQLSRSCSVNLFPRSRKISRGDWECHASSIEASECYAQFMLKYLQIPTPHFVQENLLQMNSFSSSDFKVQEIVSESVRQFAIGTCWSLRHWIYTSRSNHIQFSRRISPRLLC